MKFTDLNTKQRNDLHLQFSAYAQKLGGVNALLQLIEYVKDGKPNPLLNKEAKATFKEGKLSWGKSIYKETYDLLFKAMQKEERDGDMINGLNPKEYKSCMNMMRALQPIEIRISSNDEEAKGFSFQILDSSEAKKTKVSLTFKIIFFYDIDFAKEVLTYKAS